MSIWGSKKSSKQYFFPNPKTLSFIIKSYFIHNFTVIFWPNSSLENSNGNSKRAREDRAGGRRKDD